MPETVASDVASRIQHTLIEPALSAERIRAHCAECLTYGFDAAMIPARWVPLARDVLRGTSVKVATAVDFPYGGMTTAGRSAEVRAATGAGADQVDIGVALGLLLDGDDAAYLSDLEALVSAADGVPLKAMLELPLLNEATRRRAVELTLAAGVGWLKNASSGAVGTATVEDITFLREAAPDAGIKASGGIHTYVHAARLLDAGADLVGTSAGVAIATRREVTSSEY